MKQIQFEVLSTTVLTQLINSRSDFEVIGLGGRLMSACSLVENKIETSGMSCRVYTIGRIGTAAGSFLGGITGAVGIISAASIALHNLVTYNPDYEIEKNPFNNKIVVTYKK